MSLVGDISEFEGRPEHERMLVVGNAPSLRDVDMEQFAGIPSIGCNRILTHPSFRPTYLMVSDRRPYREELASGRLPAAADDVHVLLSTTLFDATVRCHNTAPCALPRWRWYPWRVGVSSTAFNWDSFARPLCSFASISGPMLQAAAIMGARVIGIVGIDMQAPAAEGSIHFYEHEAAWEGSRSGQYAPLTPLLPGTVLDRYRQAFDELANRGVTVLNLSPRPQTVFSALLPPTDVRRFLGDTC